MLIPLLLLLGPTLPTAATDPSFGSHLEWSADQGPAGREHAAFFVVPERDCAVLLGGSGYAPYGTPLSDAWAFEFESGNWNELSIGGDALTPGGSRRTAVVVGTAKRSTSVYLHGGYTEGQRASDDLWRAELTSEGLQVTAIDQSNRPPARFLHGFAASGSGDQLVVFGGVDGRDGLADTWIGRVEGERVEWRELETKTSPGKRFGFSFAHDPTIGRLLICGGQVLDASSGAAGMVTASDLWALDFEAAQPEWTRLGTFDAEAFPGRRNPAFTFDDATGALFVWGGTGNGASAIPGLFVVRTRAEGAPVKRILEQDGISPRASCFAILDHERRRALLGFGNDATRAMVDLVELRLP